MIVVKSTIIFFMFVVGSIRVVSESMSPTIETGSKICYIKAKFLPFSFKRGDIIIFSPSVSLFVLEGGYVRQVKMLVKRIHNVEVRRYHLYFLAFM